MHRAELEVCLILAVGDGILALHRRVLSTMLLCNTLCLVLSLIKRKKRLGSLAGFGVSVTVHAYEEKREYCRVLIGTLVKGLR